MPDSNRAGRIPTDRHVPVVVLAGFLGVGKTTLLNHVLMNAGGRRIGVLVNDFGSINIDALLVAGAAGDTVTLENGCMCCTTDSEGLAEAIGAMCDPKSGMDAVVIEASGIAEPAALIRMVLAARDTAASYGGLVYLVDSARIEETLSAHPAVRDHIAVADLVVCNKSDLVDAQRLTAVRALVGDANPTASVVAVSEAAVDPELLFDAAPQRETRDGPRQLTFDEVLIAESVDDHSHLHAAFESASIAVSGPVDPRRLAHLLQRPPDGTYRIKGTVLVDLPEHRRHAYVIQAVGGVVRVSRQKWGTAEPGTSLVIIGAGLDVGAADEALAAVVAAPDPDDENGILHLTRHLVD